MIRPGEPNIISTQLKTLTLEIRVHMRMMTFLTLASIRRKKLSKKTKKKRKNMWKKKLMKRKQEKTSRMEKMKGMTKRLSIPT